MSKLALRGVATNTERTTLQSSATAAASDIKKLGWRGVLELARQNQGLVTVTNHSRAEAVILTADAYAALMTKAGEQKDAMESTLVALQEKFDARLKSLEGKEGAAKLRAAIKSSAKLRGKIKAGATH